MMKVIGLLGIALVIGTSVAAPLQEKSSENELEEGDSGENEVKSRETEVTDNDILQIDLDRITGDKESAFKNAMTNRDSRWPNGVVPYFINPSYQSQEVDIIKEAMNEIMTSTAFKGKNCITFEERKHEVNYVKIAPIGGCYSRVGSVGKEQPVSLSKACVRKGTVMHELLHTLGFWHEQSRADRDRYITVNWANIKDGHAGNFNKFKELNIDHLEMPYDYDSIMHYSKGAFAKDWRIPTIIPTIKEGPHGPTYIGQRSYLSPIDINKIRILYGCKGVVTVEFTTPTTPAPITTTTPVPMPKGRKTISGCNFEKDTCGFSNVPDALQWTKHKGPTGSSKTGPESDHTKGDGYYMYTEASSNARKTFKMDSPILPKDDVCLDFWYHMWSKDEKEDNEFHVGSIVVKLVAGKEEPKEIWRVEADQGNEWHNGRVEIPAAMIDSKKFSIRFEGTTLGSYKSDMAVDDIQVVKGLCP